MFQDDDDDDDESTKIPSSSSGSGDGYNPNATTMTDSNVLRLIRRYDPTVADSVGIRARRSLENTRSVSHAESPKPRPLFPSSISSTSCSYLAQRPLNSTQDNNRTVKQTSTPRLQRQKTAPEQDTSSDVPSSSQPILKYTPPRTDLNLETKPTEPLTIEIESHIPPPISHVNKTNYQPLITTAPKRVCAAISKSEWDLRLQQDLPSSIIPTTTTTTTTTPATTTTTTINNNNASSTKVINHQSKTKSSYRPLLGRSKSIMVLNNNQHDQDNDMDDFDENSAPMTPNTTVNKLKQMFASKMPHDKSPTPSRRIDRTNSVEPNPNQRLSSATPTDFQTRTIPNVNLTKPTTVVQQPVPTPSPLFKRPILKSQKTFDRYVIVIFL